MYSPKVPIKDYSNWIHQLGARDSGNDFRFPDIAAYTGCFHFFGRISSVVSFRGDIQQGSIFINCLGAT